MWLIAFLHLHLSQIRPDISHENKTFPIHWGSNRIPHSEGSEKPSTPVSIAFDKLAHKREIRHPSRQPFNPDVQVGGEKRKVQRTVGYFILGGSICLPYLALPCLPAHLPAWKGRYYGVTKVLYGLPKPHKDSPQARTPVIVCVCIFFAGACAGAGARSPYMCSEGEGGIG